MARPSQPPPPQRLREREAPRSARPVQLELFGPQRPAATAKPAPPAPSLRPGEGSRSPRPALPAPRSAPSGLSKAERKRISAADAEARRRELLRRLNRFAGGKVSDVSLHDNRRVILTVRAERSGLLAPLQLRIHRSFIEAPEEVLQAVASFVQSRKGSPHAREALGVIREHFHRHRPSEARTARLEPLGVCFDLREILAELNDRFFAGSLEVGITWGRSLRAGSCGGRRRRRTSTIQLGSYAYEEKLVRIHRALDHPSVPRYVVEAVVYHELLHADLPPVTVNGRHHFHTPEFRRRERLFRLLPKTEAWIEEHLPELLVRRDPKARLPGDRRR